MDVETTGTAEIETFPGKAAQGRHVRLDAARLGAARKAFTTRNVDFRLARRLTSRIAPTAGDLVDRLSDGPGRRSSAHAGG